MIAAALLYLASAVWAMIFHFRRGSEPPSRGMRLIVGLVAVFAAVEVFAFWTKPLQHPRGGLALYVAALLLLWSAVSVTRGGRLGIVYQNDRGAGLVSRGPYRFWRHPFYLSYSLAWLAGFVGLGWWPLAMISLLMTAIYAHAARREERALLAGPFGLDYRQYTRQAGWLVPSVRAVRRRRTAPGV